MILAGIDMGIEATKAVVLRDGAIIGRAKASTGGTDRPIQARQAYDAALAAAGIAAIEVEAVSATGIGKYDVPFAGRRVTEVIAAAHGAVPGRHCGDERRGRRDPDCGAGSGPAD